MPGSRLERRSGGHLRGVVGRLRRSVVVEAVSTAWESPAVDSDGPDYINAAVLVRTPMPLAVLKAQLKAIEEEMGRDRGRPERSRSTSTSSYLTRISWKSIFGARLTGP